MTSCEIFTYEALLRGAQNEAVSLILAQIPQEELHQFDQECRVTSLTLATRLGIDCHLNLNVLPQSLLTSETTVSSTLTTATQCHFPIEHIVLEILEGEIIQDAHRFGQLLDKYRGMGIKIAIDDFGAGYAGLNFLADFQPDLVKIDMHLVRNIERNGPRQAIVSAIVQVCRDLGIDVIAEGVETIEEYQWFREVGVYLFQGYLFAKPTFEGFSSIQFPQ